MTSAKDLTKQAPRSPKTRLGGYVILARMIDKGRASLAGTAGDYHFACPLDQSLLGFKEVKADDVKNLLASGASDEQVVAWIEEHGAKKTPAEIEAWSAGNEAWSLYNDPSTEKQAYFTGECTKLGLDPAKASSFDWLDADDAATFKK
jgi:Domain of unknown function (DUF5069)